MRHGWGRWGGAVGGAAGLSLVLVLGTATLPGAHLSGPSPNPSVFHACVRNRTGTLRIVGAGGECNGNETPLHWSSGRLIDIGLTVLDTLTGREWEKKTTAVGSGPNFPDLHDVDNQYNWFDATGPWIAAVNAEGFAGHTDWRVAMTVELSNIIDPTVPACGIATACVDRVFGPTAPSFHWGFPSNGFVSLAINLANGTPFPFPISNGDLLFVRAVRGGP